MLMKPHLSVRHSTYSSMFATHLTLRPMGLHLLYVSYSGPNSYMWEMALINHLSCQSILSQHFCIYTFKFNIKYSLKYSFQFRRHKTSGWLTQSPCGCRSPVPVETSVVTPICLQNDQALGWQCLCFIRPSLWHRNMVPEQQSSSQVGCCCKVNWLPVGQYKCRPNNATTFWLTAMQRVCCCCHIICLPQIITLYPGFSPPPGPLKRQPLTTKHTFTNHSDGHPY